jgi:hypothetical protein
VTGIVQPCSDEASEQYEDKQRKRTQQQVHGGTLRLIDHNQINGLVDELDDQMSLGESLIIAALAMFQRSLTGCAECVVVVG